MTSGSVAVSVRLATGADAPVLAELASELDYPSSAGAMALRLDHLLGRPDHGIIVAELTRAVVGWMHVTLVHSLERDSFCEIRGLVVGEARRGHGIGTVLVDAAEQWARTRGCFRMRVRSNILRRRAHDLYLRLGYVEEKTQRVFDKTLARQAEPSASGR